jgi:predicted TIM-barrel enzyme
MAIEIYPVIHVSRWETAADQADMALNFGGDGVYLIDHQNTREDNLFLAFNQVVSDHPESYIGLNLLSRMNALWAFKALQEAVDSDEIIRLPDGLWVDDASILAEEVKNLRETDPRLKSIRYLGGISFKYTSRYSPLPAPSVKELYELADYVDVPVTTGEGTGVAASVEKIRAMYKVAHEMGKQLAVASGISYDNLPEYKDCVDQVLIATSLEDVPMSGVFNPIKLKSTIDLAKSFS